jgi:RNA polymerase sigma factor (sigma-70 family)
MLKLAVVLRPDPTVAVNSKDRLTRYFLEMRDELLRFLTRRAGRAAAEDVLQDTWLKLRERGDPAGWREPRAILFTTAANLATDLDRHNAVVGKHSAHEALVEGVEVEYPRPDPESYADTVESLERLHAALMELPLVCRDAFLMNRIDAMTHAEIATRLGISTKSVQRYVERALRHCLRVVDP